MGRRRGSNGTAPPQPKNGGDATIPAAAPSPNIMYLLAVITVAGAALTASLWSSGTVSMETYETLHRTGPSHVQESVAQVEVVDWAQVKPTLPAGTTLGSYLKGRDVALKLINSGPEQWPASKWLPSSLLKAFQQAGNDSLWLMESQTAENVYYDEDMEEALRKGGVQTSANSKTVEIHMDTLHKKLKQANDGQPAGYWYLNGELAPPDLAAEVTLPEDTLEYSVFDDGERFAHPEALACRLAPNKRRNNKQSRKLCPEEQPAKRMWIGSAGLVACMHYDTSYNTHTVVYGAKHIMVAPPDSFDKVYFHPAVHPSHRQSQIINMTHPDLAHFPRAKDMGASETVLRPGETIYIPPYWLHSVRSITTTIAVSIWTESAEGRLADAAGAMPSAVSNRPQIFNTLWDTLSESATVDTSDKETVVGGCMLWYTRKLLATLEEHLSSAGEGLVAGSVAWLELHFEQSFGSEGIRQAKFCERKARCVTGMEIEGTDIEAALDEVTAQQFARFKALFTHRPSVASMALWVHVQGIGSSGIVADPTQTCRWVRDCLLPTMRGDAPREM